MKYLKDILTEIDGESYSTARAAALAGLLEYLVLAAWDFFQSGHFQMQEFGIGLGAVIAAVGVAIKMGEK